MAEIIIDDPVKYYKELAKELNGLNKTVTTKVKVDYQDIKRRLTEDMKRELQGRSSYGLGV